MAQSAEERRLGYAWRAAACAAALLLAPGCAMCPDLRGPGFGEEFAGWTDNLRPEQPDTQPWGVSTKAQQVERDLGVGN